MQQYSSLNKVLIKVYNKIYRKDLKKKLHPSKTAIAAAAYQLREGKFFEVVFMLMDIVSTVTESYVNITGAER